MSRKENNNQHNNIPELKNEIEMKWQEVEIAINSVKNRELPGQEGITNELVNYGDDKIDPKSNITM